MGLWRIKSRTGDGDGEGESDIEPGDPRRTSGERERWIDNIRLARLIRLLGLNPAIGGLELKYICLSVAGLEFRLDSGSSLKGVDERPLMGLVSGFASSGARKY